MNKKNIGIICIIIASLLWAMEAVFAKFSYSTSNALQISVVRAIVVSIIALLYIYFSKAKIKVSGKNLTVLVYVALAGTILGDLIYFLALTKLTIVNALVISHLQPIFIVLFGFFLLKDKLTKFDYIGIVLMIFAGLFITTRSIENLFSFRFGTMEDVLLLLATILWASGNVMARKYLQKLNAGVVTFYRYIISSVVLFAYLSLTSFISINIYQILIGISAGLGTILYYESLNRIKAAQVSSLELSTPFFAAILGVVILNEIITVMQVLGIFLLIVGVYFLSRKEHL